MAQETKRIKNPYLSTEASVDKESEMLFTGRAEALSWLEAHLALPPAERKPLALTGPAQVGKSWLLRYLASAKRAALSITPLHIDVEPLPTNSLGAFLRALAYEIHQAMNTEVALRKTQFIAEPLTAFYQQGLLPLLGDDGRFLLLLDNADKLLTPANGDISVDDLLPLHDRLLQANQSALLFALTLSEAEVDAATYPWLAQVHHYHLQPLTAAETAVLVQDPAPYPVVANVANYIHTLTQGYPAKIQRLCHALFERWQQQHLQQITVADAAIVWQKMKANTPPADAAPPSFGIAAKAHSNDTLHNVKRWRSIPRRTLLRAGGAAAALLLILGLSSLTIQFVRAQVARAEEAQLAQATIASEQTATAIAALRPTDIPDELNVAAAETAQPTETASPVPSATPSPTTTPTLTPSPTATSTPTPSEYAEVVVRTQDGMPMIYIPAGAFIMGSAEDDVVAAADEKPLRTVTMDAFYIDQYEVNIEQYAAFLNQLGDYQRACENVDCALPQQIAGYTSYLLEQDLGDGTVQYFPVTGFANYPANHISWFGAKAYCAWVGARLPTEAEWEYAARGGDGRLYPWGDIAPDDTKAVFQSNDYENLKPVDALPDGASPFGVYGMAGSLWEWTADWYSESYYQDAPNSNPTGPETGFARVLRGGAWPYNNQADRIRSANRFSLAPEFISSTVGFRCARTP